MLNFYSGKSTSATANDRRRFLGILTMGVFFSSCAKSEVLSKDIDLTFPISGSISESDKPIEILWNSILIDKVDLFYSVDNGENWKTIAQNIDAIDGKYGWIPKRLNTENILLKIQDSNDSSFLTLSSSIEIWESASLEISVYPELLMINSVVVINDLFFDNFAITNLGNSNFHILSLTCTHAGCSLQKKDEQFECPCHGSVFKISGCVKQGPAIENLSQYYNTFDTVSQKITIFRKQIKIPC